eukprot:6210114-Pleurochrysis_carterae.AAC.3
MPPPVRAHAARHGSTTAITSTCALTPPCAAPSQAHNRHWASSSRTTLAQSSLLLDRPSS